VKLFIFLIGIKGHLHKFQQKFNTIATKLSNIKSNVLSCVGELNLQI